jgi:hypothetical protein
LFADKIGAINLTVGGVHASRHTLLPTVSQTCHLDTTVDAAFSWEAFFVAMYQEADSVLLVDFGPGPITIAIIVALIADLDAPSSGLIGLDERVMQRLQTELRAESVR